MNIQDLKSKSDINALNLIDHSILTGRISTILFDISDKSGNPELRKCAYYAGLLHDIGKATNQFQNILSKNIDEYDHIDNDDNKPKYKYLHNEIGWAFLSSKINYYVNNHSYSDYILNNIYYSHGLYNLDDYKNTDIEILKDDENIINELYEYLIQLPTSNISKLEQYKEDLKYSHPNYYIQFDKATDENQIIQKNNKMLYLRSIVRYADALASKNIFNICTTDDEIKQFILDSNKSNSNIEIKKCEYFNTPRFNEQLDISNKIEKDKTTIIKAPTGFGKTLVGLLWFARHKEKMLWVCPTNNLSYCIYNSIINELKLFGDNNVSVQLYLTNEVKECNKPNIPDFEADIVITNLDNYLKPNIDSSYGSRLYNIYNRKTVFDEIQEYITDAPLFACFISSMSIRHNYIKTETLCLSATPSILHTKWDTRNNETIILPNKTEHYKSFVNQNITINCNNYLTSDIIISNSVSETQRKKEDYNKELIIHSHYLEKDKRDKINNILSIFGKGSNDIKTLSSSLILQSGFDISTKTMSDSILSPETTLQRIGRIDRWNDKGGGIYNFDLYDNQSENKVSKMLYDGDLREKWFIALKIIDGQTLSLNELYIFYNKFVAENAQAIKKSIDDRYDKSIDGLYDISYNKSNKKLKSDDSINAGGNVLRSMDNEIFCLFKDENGNWMNEAINCKVYNGNFWDGGIKDTKLLNAYLNKCKKELKKLLSNPNFNYNKKLNISTINKLKNIDKLRKMAINSKMPYLRFDEYYSSELGIKKYD